MKNSIDINGNNLHILKCGCRFCVFCMAPCLL